MENIDIKAYIDKQIDELNERRFLFVIKSKRLKDCNNLNKLEERLIMAKRGYSLFIILSVICGGFLYFAGFAQIFQHNIVDWTKSGLLIIVTIGTIGTAWNHKIDYERLRMIKYLKELEKKVTTANSR
jgi:hypothetical protein